MKKHTKLLSFLLVLSLLFTTVFATNVFAQDGTVSGEQTVGETAPEAIVGSYTAPSGAWVPTDDYKDIVYGVWASEADYLAGVAPTKWYSDNEFTGERIGTTDNNGQNYGDPAFIPGYVHCFGDVINAISSRLPTGQHQQLTINLAGHTLTSGSNAWTGGFRVGGLSGVVTTAMLKITNGTFEHVGGQMQTRRQAKLIYENVVYNYRGGSLMYDDGSALLEFKSSKLNIFYGNASFGMSLSYSGRLSFIDTDIKYEVAPTNTLIMISTVAGKDSAQSATVFFDKDSSLNCPYAMDLVRVNHNFVYAEGTTPVYPSFNTKQYLTFETGFTMSEQVVPTSVCHAYHSVSEGKSGQDVTYEPITEDSPLVIRAQKAGTSFLMDFATVSTDVPGMVEVIMAPTGETAWNPATDSSGVDYSGITYGVWASENEYLLGRAPTKWYKTTELVPSTVGSTDINGENFADPSFIPGYVHLFANVEIKTQIATGNEQKLVINLGGYSTTGNAYRVGGSSSSHPKASLTVKNGIFNFTDGQLHIRPDSCLIFEDVVINCTLTKDRDFVYGAGGDLVKFTNCTFNSQNGNPFKFSYTTAAGGLTGKFIFENTDLNFASSPTNYLFYFNETKWGNSSFDIFFDKDSSINGIECMLCHFNEGSEDNTAQVFNNQHTVTFEEGFTYNGSNKVEDLPTQYSIKHFGSSESELCRADDAIMKYSNIASVEPPVDPDPPVDPNPPVDPDPPVGPNPPEEPDPELPEFPIIAYDKDGEIVKKWTTNHISDGIIDYVPSGGTIKLFANATFGNIHTKEGWSLTFDLNGFKFTSVQTANNQLGYAMSASWNERVVKFISSAPERGTIDATKNTINLLQARPGSIVLFENLNIYLGGNMFNDGGAKSITFKDCYVETTGGVIAGSSGLGTGASGVDRHFVFDNTVTKNLSFVTLSHKDQLDYVYITMMNGSVIDNSIVLVNVTDVAHNKHITFNIESGVTFTVPNLSFATIATAKSDYAIRYFSEITDVNEPGTPADLSDVFLCEAGDGKSDVRVKNDIDFTKYAYSIASVGSIGIMRLKRAADGAKEILSCTDIMAIEAGSTVIFYTNIFYDPAGSTAGQGRIHGYKNGIVYDLNGHSFNFSGYRFQLEGSFTFKNGTLDLAGTNTVPFMGDPGVNAVMEFSDVEINLSYSNETYIFINAYTGSLVFRGCTLDLPVSCVAFRMSEGNGQSILIEDSRVTAGSLIKADYKAGAKYSYVVSGSELDIVGGTILDVQCTATDKAGVSLLLSDSKIKSAGFVSSATNVLDVTVTECFMSVAPELDGAMGTLRFGNGEKLMTIADDTFGYRVTKLGIKIKANLLLESVFGVQFFIPVDTNMISITIDGVTYKVSELTETVVYDNVTYKLVALKGILPSEAAEVIDITVSYMDAEMLHTVKTGYSVLDYVASLLNTDHSYLIKQLAVAAVEYISAAYAYTESTNAELAALMQTPNYLANLPAAKAPTSSASNIGTASAAVNTVCLDLGATMKLRLNLVSAFSGTITVEDTTYVVENGKVGELSYVEVEMAAHEFYDELVRITGPDGTVNGTVDLASYVMAVSADSSLTASVKQLVVAFYTYCAYADTYVSAVID